MSKGYRPTPPVGSPEFVQQAGVVQVQRVYKNGDVEDEARFEEPLAVRVFLTEPAKVGASMKRVVNTGNYESYHLEASVYLPCYAEEAEEALKMAAEIAGGFVIAEENALREELAKAATKNQKGK